MTISALIVQCLPTFCVIVGVVSAIVTIAFCIKRSCVKDDLENALAKEDARRVKAILMVNGSFLSKSIKSSIELWLAEKVVTAHNASGV